MTLSLDLKTAKEQLWKSSVLSWKLHKTQLEMYEAIAVNPSKLYVLNCSRQIGKSFFLCVLAVEYALKHPGAKICYIAPQARMVKKIILPRIRQILRDCPSELKPNYKVNEQSYTFKHNESEIHIAGTDSERAENIRGQVFNLVICDEAGFMDELDYVVTSILFPTISTTKGRIILSSTPPPTPDHAFLRYVRDADAGGYYMKKTIYDNPLIDKNILEELKKHAGGDNSAAWRREYLAEFVTSEEDAIFPEATEDRMSGLIKRWPRPPFYDSYVSADLGYADNTGILFAYFDFLANKIIIEGEELFSKPNSEKIAISIKGKEKLLWESNGTIKEPYKRIIDGNDITISDLNGPTYNLRFVKTRNDDLQAAVNEVRVMLQNEQIIFSPDCKQTIAQVKYGIWDTTKKKFARSEGAGHFDLIAALIYLVRNVARYKNPYPPGLGLDLGSMYIDPRKQRDPSKGVTELSKVLSVPYNKIFRPEDS